MSSNITKYHPAFPGLYLKKVTKLLREVSVCLFSPYLLIHFSVPDAILGTRDALMRKTR